ncbi:MAG: hypothetical protein JKX95_08705 [Bacteroidia bacterium]|nr:hypothetical protein [Bacteroidia bacterium]
MHTINTALPNSVKDAFPILLVPSEIPSTSKLFLTSSVIPSFNCTEATLLPFPIGATIVKELHSAFAAMVTV